MTLASIGNGFKQFFQAIVLGVDHNTVSDEDIAQVDQSQLNEDGAPVESKSPLGYHVSYLTAAYLVISGVIGTGAFATPATILGSIGSVGASYVLWTAGFLIGLLILMMLIEYLTYFPRRSGGMTAYLEQAYPHPRLLIPVTFSASSVCLSYITSSAAAFSQYVFKGADYEATAWQQRGLSVAPLLVAAIVTSLSTKWSLRLNNVIGFAKVVFILFVGLSGLAALAGSTKAPKNHAIFHNAWEGTTSDGNAISNAILKVVFSYGGLPYVFTAVGETNPKATIRTFKYFVPVTLFLIYILYILCVTAYYAGIGNKEEIIASGNLVAAVYFEKIFGTKAAVRAMAGFVSLSSMGHLLTAFIAHARILRECGRQGVLPFPQLWSSVKPFGTPIFPIFVTLLVNLIVLLAPPPGDAYNFITDLGTYCDQIFQLFLAFGLFKVRRARKKRGLGYREFHIPTVLLVIVFLWSLFVIAMAFVPPKGTLIGSDVSFFYATYPIVMFGLLGLCVVYYFLWSYVWPHWKGYRHRIVSFEEDGGVKGHKVIKVPVADLEEWDREHGPQRETLVADGFADEPQGSFETTAFSEDVAYVKNDLDSDLAVTKEKGQTTQTAETEQTSQSSEEKTQN